MGGVETAVKASAMSGPTMAAVPCGINGFGRIGRLVARIMIKDPETNVRCPKPLQRLASCKDAHGLPRHIIFLNF